MTTQGHAAQPPVGAELDHVILASRGADTQAETGEIVVPIEPVRSVAGDPVDGAVTVTGWCQLRVASSFLL